AGVGGAAARGRRIRSRRGGGAHRRARRLPDVARAGGARPDGVDGVEGLMRTLRPRRREPGSDRPHELPVVRSPYDDPELYDLLFDGYTEDRDFYLELARAARGPVLDLACGSGRLLIPALAAGVDIDGLELESAMLGELTRKARARGLEPRAYPGDMRNL